MDVTVIIPTLNEEKYLGQCLKSLTNQEFDGNFEMIIGDGCSKDKTHKICEEYGAKFVLEPKPTISAGRAKACEKAKGKIIISTDADINAPKEWMQSIVDGFNGNVAVYGNVVPYDGNPYETWMCKNVMDKYMWVMDKIGTPVPAGSNLSFTRKAYNEAGGFNPEIITAEDLDLVNRLKPLGKIVYSPKSVVYVSMRRVKGWGYKNYVKFHVTNAIKFHTTGKSHDSYEPIR